MNHMQAGTKLYFQISLQQLQTDLYGYTRCFHIHQEKLPETAPFIFMISNWRQVLTVTKI